MTGIALGRWEIEPPSDGGRGREWRFTRWTLLRWFGWDCGWASYRSKRRFFMVRWTVLWREAWFGLWMGPDDDGDIEVVAGIYPLRFEFNTGPWGRPMDSAAEVRP